MGDSDSDQKKGVPSWQLKVKETTPTEGDTDSEEPTDTSTIAEKAKKFLEEDEVRNAPTDKKIAFLESKGLVANEINELLGVTRNTEASSTSTSTSPPPAQPGTQISKNTQPNSTHQYTSLQQSTPPIITYPEFLTTPPHPTPLVTKTRLLTTLYAFSGLSAILYGTNTYILTPMLSQLISSRLSLAETASTNLQTLNQKLEPLVSEIPLQSQVQASREAEEEGSEDEDPTELFHHDIGVQTSLPPTPRPSSPFHSSSHPTNTILEEQTTRLTTLSTSIKELNEASESEGRDASDLNTTVGVLREYLDGLAYVVPTYGHGVGGYLGAAVGGGKEDDEIARVKAGIRGVKGVLLSTRSFPAARAR